MRALVLLPFLLGCGSAPVRVDPVEPPTDFQSRPANWAHELSVAYLAECGPGEVCVESMIRDPRAVRYIVMIKVSAFDVPYVTEQLSPDGTELETLQVTLSVGDPEDQLVAQFVHTVRVDGVETLRFEGKTTLPRPVLFDESGRRIDW